MSEVLTEIQAPPAKLAEPNPVLLRAAAIVRERWTQDSATALEGPPRCAMTAIAEIADRAGDASLFWTARAALVKSLGLASEWMVPDWNDAPGRTKEEVAEALERAAWGL